VPKENAKKFLALLSRDKKLQEAVKECVMAEEHIVKIAEKRGYEFSAQELDEALLEKWGHSTFKKINPMVTFSQTPGF
jgi:predicted ribosomally synthesized peptide with nif11-like leader